MLLARCAILLATLMAVSPAHADEASAKAYDFQLRAGHSILVSMPARAGWSIDSELKLRCYTSEAPGERPCQGVAYGKRGEIVMIESRDERDGEVTVLITVP